MGSRLGSPHVVGVRSIVLPPTSDCSFCSRRALVVPALGAAPPAGKRGRRSAFHRALGARLTLGVWMATRRMACLPLHTGCVAHAGRVGGLNRGSAFPRTLGVRLTLGVWMATRPMAYLPPHTGCAAHAGRVDGVRRRSAFHRTVVCGSRWACGCGDRAHGLPSPAHWVCGSRWACGWRRGQWPTFPRTLGVRLTLGVWMA